MTEKDFMTAEEKGKQIIRAAFTVLTILGLLTAVAVVAANLINKLKASVKMFNEDGVLEPIEDKELTGESSSDHGESKGCNISLDDGCEL